MKKRMLNGILQERKVLKGKGDVTERGPGVRVEDLVRHDVF
jgi:hypothetical protein